MSKLFRRFVAVPKAEYSEANEKDFRKEVEMLAREISSELEQIRTGIDTRGSLYSKREHLISPTVGVVIYP